MKEQNEKRKIAILGSTGSIGTQTLEIVDAHSDSFEVSVLTANNNHELLIQQALKFKPNTVVISNESKYEDVKEALKNEYIKVFAGYEAINQIVQTDDVDIVVTAMVGFAGLQPTIKAIEAGKTIALANKETLVVAGDYISKLAIEKKVSVIPVDSEHSAIFQCLVGELDQSVEKIILTASGGPFRGYTPEMLRKVNLKQALNHPNWSMGKKITIDSASMMNKGLEMIEAKWLFGLDPSQIEVVIHPESIIHSFVQFVDGSLKAQLSVPDMRLPILYALSYPTRLPSMVKRISFSEIKKLTFEQPDTSTFRNLVLAKEAMTEGGNKPCILNAANEVAVEAFLTERIAFSAMPDIIEKSLDKLPFIKDPRLDDYIQSDKETREYAKNLIS